MNVANIIFSDKISGAERILIDYLLYSSRFQSNNNISIIANDGDIVNEISNLNTNIRIHTLNVNNSMKCINKIRKICKDNNIEILHAHDNKASLLSYLATRFLKRNVKIISHIHNSYSFLEKGGLPKFIDSLFRIKYSGNIFCTKNVYNYYSNHAKYFSKLNNKIIIENSTSIERNDMKSNVIPDDQDYEILLKLKKTNKIYGFVGRYEDQKGLIPFFDNLYIRSNELIGLSFVFFGSGSQKKILEDFVYNNKLTNKVIITGYKKNIFPYLKLFDFLILPSKFEGLPIILLEAMSLGIPAIAMSVGGVSDLVDNSNGFLVDKDDYGKFLNDLIISSKISKEDYLLLSNQAKIKIEYKYDIKKYTSLIFDYYISILSKENP